MASAQKITRQMLIQELRPHGIKGLYRLRKADLLELKRQQDSGHNILDEPIPNIIAPVLTPFPFKKVKQNINTVKQKTKDWLEWLINYIPEPIKNKVAQVSHTAQRGLDYVKKLVMNTRYKDHFQFIETTSALKKYANQYTLNMIRSYDPESFLEKVKPTVLAFFEKHSGIKTKLILECKMEKIDPATGKNKIVDASFASNPEIVLQGTDIPAIYDNMTDKVLENMTTFQRQGSNWRFHSIVKMDIHTVKYQPLKGSSYIPLPKVLANTKALVNVKNNDDECFKWAVTSCVYPVEVNPHRLSKYKENSRKFNWENINFPVSLKDVAKFEKQNPGYSVNVFGYNKSESVFPLRINKTMQDNVVDLLMISDGEKQHYCWIKNLSRLLTKQVSKKKISRVYCRNCLLSFDNESSLGKHQEYCHNNEAVKFELPKEEDLYIKFKNYERSMKVPFVIYADFECFTEDINTCQPDPQCSYTKKYQKHTPSGFCYILKCFDDELYNDEFVIYTKKSENDDVAQVFVDSIEKTIKSIYQQFKFPKAMIMTKKDKRKICKDREMPHL